MDTTINQGSKPLLTLAQSLLKPRGKILDLACGDGRNGLKLEQHGFALSYLDRDQQALAKISEQSSHGEIICGDLESAKPQHQPYRLPVAIFDAILVFRYLHRPLFGQIIAALKPGGLIIYETFTREQASIGRPKNPDFLLNKNELRDRFSDFEVIHFFEGYCDKQQVYLSQIIAKKPGQALRSSDGLC